MWHSQKSFIYVISFIFIVYWDIKNGLSDSLKTYTHDNNRMKIKSRNLSPLTTHFYANQSSLGPCSY